MAEGGEQFDRRGYHKKVYKPRLSPDEQWRGDQFVARYRLSKERVHSLAKDYGRYSTRTQGTNVGGGVSYFEQMCLAIRYLATGANMSCIAETQQLSLAMVSRCVADVVRYFYYYHHRYIIWPDDTEEKMAVSHQFHRDHQQKPLVFGLIDGTHIPIVSPSLAREAVFVNRKGYYSLNTTVVCDSKLRILYINPCYAGAANDAYCFYSSELFTDAEAGAWDNFLLLGDAGYKQTDYLFVPYDDPATQQQKNYNIWHRSIRSKVERCIGLLKQRWRCLDASGGYIQMKPEKVARIVFACACLHNCAIEDKVGLMEELDLEDDRFVVRFVAPPQPDPEVIHGERPVRKTKRDRYAEHNFPAA